MARSGRPSATRCGSPRRTARPPHLPRRSHRCRPGWASEQPVAAIVDHAQAPRVIAILLVRLGGYAAGVFDGDELIASKVGSRQVHGRSAAGGWSQHRFARRREGQVKVALAKAADTAAEVVLPLLSRLDAVVTGGDRQALQTVLADPRLAAVAAVGDRPASSMCPTLGHGCCGTAFRQVARSGSRCRNLSSPE